MIGLRPYQMQGAAAIRRALSAGRHPLYVLPTGAGKIDPYTVERSAP